MFHKAIAVICIFLSQATYAQQSFLENFAGTWTYEDGPFFPSRKISIERYKDTITVSKVFKVSTLKKSGKYGQSIEDFFWFQSHGATDSQSNQGEFVMKEHTSYSHQVFGDSLIIVALKKDDDEDFGHPKLPVEKRKFLELSIKIYQVTLSDDKKKLKINIWANELESDVKKLIKDVTPTSAYTFSR